MQVLTQYEVTIDTTANRPDREVMCMLRQAIDTPAFRARYAKAEQEYLHARLEEGDYMTHIETYSHPQHAKTPFNNKFRLYFSTL